MAPGGQWGAASLGLGFVLWAFGTEYRKVADLDGLFSSHPRFSGYVEIGLGEPSTPHLALWYPRFPFPAEMIGPYKTDP